MIGKILYERQGNIGIIILDRPRKMHAFDESMWTAFESVLSTVEKDIPRALVITGSGDKAFCAGFDVSVDNPQVPEFFNAIKNNDSDSVRVIIKRIRGAVDRLASLPVPVIAAINGLAYGGGAELAARCDMRIADPGAVICFSEVRLGLMTDWGGGVALSRLVGQSKAAEYILSAKKISAYDALSAGLVNIVSAPGKALEESIDLAEDIAKNGPTAVRNSLLLIRKSRDMSMAESLDLESELAVSLIVSGECVHGITALMSKKDPVFPDPDEMSEHH